MGSREGETSSPGSAMLFCTAAARLAAHLSCVSLRRTGAYVLDTGDDTGARVVLTIPSHGACDATPTVDVFDAVGFLRSHELDPAAARLVYVVMTRQCGRDPKRAPVLVDDALLALARWHDARAEHALRILTHRVGSIANEVTHAERRPGATTAVSSSG